MERLAPGAAVDRHRAPSPAPTPCSTETTRYCASARPSASPSADFQNTRFAARRDEHRARRHAARTTSTACIGASDGRLTAVDAAKAKWWATELQKRVVDRCLQLHGGYGYMMEYPVARAFMRCPLQRIYGGTNEIMKEIIGRDIARCAAKIRPIDGKGDPVDLVEVSRPSTGVLQLTLSRPDALNTLNAALVSELHARLEAVERDPACRVLVLTGAAGLLRRARSSRLRRRGTGDRARKGEADAGAAAGDRRTGPAPARASPAGDRGGQRPAAGGGLALALASDIRIASTAAVFAVSFIRAGFSGCASAPPGCCPGSSAPDGPTSSC